VIELSAGDELVNAPGIGGLGGDHVAAGAASAAPTPSAQMALAPVTAVVSLVKGRLSILDLAFSGKVCLHTAGEARQGYDPVAEPESSIPGDFPGFSLSFLMVPLDQGPMLGF